MSRGFGGEFFCGRGWTRHRKEFSCRNSTENAKGNLEEILEITVFFEETAVEFREIGWNFMKFPGTKGVASILVVRRKADGARGVDGLDSPFIGK
jgi:hypothetical protein